VERARFLGQGLRDLGPDEDLHWAWVRHPFLNWREGWDPAKRTVVVHGHSVEWREGLSKDVLHYAVSAVDSHRRINLDLNAWKIGAVAVLEAVEDRYRIHLVRP
jgi:serine/threonine protein phosphatase 1